MSVLFRLAYAVERVAELLPRTTVGRLFVNEEQRRIGYETDSPGDHVVCLGSVVIYYSSPSVFRRQRQKQQSYLASLGTD